MFNSSSKKFTQIGKKTESILSVFQKAKTDLEANVAEYEQLEVEVTEEIIAQQGLLAEVSQKKNSGISAMHKFTEWLGE